MKTTRIVAMLAALLLLLSLCGCTSYERIQPTVQSLHAVAIVHAEDAEAIANALPDGATVTPELKKKLEDQAASAEDIRRWAAELDRLVKGEPAAEPQR